MRYWVLSWHHQILEPSNMLTANIQNKNDIQFLSQLVKRLVSKHFYFITMYISLYTIKGEFWKYTGYEHSQILME
jgi:hypothetical protein